MTMKIIGGKVTS